MQSWGHQEWTTLQQVLIGILALLVTYLMRRLLSRFVAWCIRTLRASIRNHPAFWLAPLLVVAVLAAARLLLPCPSPDGYWKGMWYTCCCGRHSFARFAEGYGTSYEIYHDECAIRSACTRMDGSTWKWAPSYLRYHRATRTSRLEETDFVLLKPGWFFMTRISVDGDVRKYRRTLGSWGAADILKTKTIQTPEENMDYWLAKRKADRDGTNTVTRAKSPGPA